MKYVIILGAAVWPNSTPSPSLLRRCNAAISLAKSIEYDYIIPSGGLGKHPPSEASVMQSILIDAGIAKTKIRLEDQATTTLETAKYVRDLCDNSSAAEIVVVSDRYHLLRTRLAFWAYGMSSKGFSASSFNPVSSWRLTLKQWSRECAAIPFYLIQAMRVKFGSKR